MLLHGSYGNSTAFATLDEAYLHRIVNAMQDGILNKIPSAELSQPLSDTERSLGADTSTSENEYLSDASSRCRVK